MTRNAINDVERSALRRWVKNTKPTPRQIDAIRWFQQQYGRRLNQSSVSASLGPSYAHLDGPDPISSLTSRKRQSKWPLLEAILYDWQLFIESQGGDTSDDAILLKAKDVWPLIPQYQGQATPEFSNGWLSKYKRRHNIQSHRRHGEAADVPQSTEAQMSSIRVLCAEYAEKDIFNMDETGLFWRQAPSSGLATQARAGRKNDKTRISLACCCNYDGTERLPLWAIGKAARPHALRRVNIEALGMVWKSNTKAWMTTVIMREWLQSFYDWIGTSRSVVLLLDNFSAHAKGLDSLPPPPNIKVQFLPPNSTSQYQPLDQGIIAAFKQSYRKQWIRFMVDCYGREQNPLTETNLNFAVGWVSYAWFEGLSNQTIFNCFRKAKIKPSEEPVTLVSLLPSQELQDLYQEAQQLGNFSNDEDLEHFLKAAGEDDAPGEDSFDLAQVVALHTQEDCLVEEDEEEESEVIPVASPTYAEAEAAVDVLLKFHTHAERSTTDHINNLRAIQSRIRLWKTSDTVQGTLDSWLT